MTTITIEVPDELASGYPNKAALERTLLEDFVIEQRQRGVISLGRAAEILGLSYAEFFALLGKKGLSFVNASVEEKEGSYSAFEEMMEQQKK